MKKKITEENFDLLSIESRWKKNPSDTFRLDQDSQEVRSQAGRSQAGRSQVGRSQVGKSQVVRPQVQQLLQQTIPKSQRRHEDTQHFKIRLEHLLTVFKTDAVGEFLSMKRSMLEDQKDKVKQDTAKYLSLYQEKHAEASSLKEELAASQHATGHLSKVVQQMSLKLLKCREQQRRTRLLHLALRTLSNYKLERQKKKLRNQLANAFFLRTSGRRMFGGWAKPLQEKRAKQREEQRRAAQKQQFEEACLRYQKEIVELKSRLQQAMRAIRDMQANKMSMQDELKKAFMRGVSALNFEAMNVLQAHPGTIPDRPPAKENRLSNSQVMPVPSSYIKSETLGSSRADSSSKVVVYQQGLESKEHRWKDAQVVGQPVSLLRNGLIRAETQDLPQLSQTSHDEGKVIKVSKGKSFVERPKK